MGVSPFLHGLTPSKCRCERAPGRKVERHTWDYLRQNRDFSACFGRFSGRIAWKNLAAARASAKQAAARIEQANGKDQALMEERKALVAKRYELPAGSPISRRCKRRSTASKLYRVVRNRKILQDHQNGISARALFDPYMLSERQIWDILAEGEAKEDLKARLQGFLDLPSRGKPSPRCRRYGDGQRANLGLRLKRPRAP